MVKIHIVIEVPMVKTREEALDKVIEKIIDKVEPVKREYNWWTEVEE